MKKSAAAKRQSPTQISWEQILANLDDGVIALDTQSKIIFFNEASEMLTEISSGTAVDQSFAKIFKREPWLLDLVKTTHAPPHKRVGAEGDLVSRWGRKLPVGVTVSPLRDRQGQFIGTILLLRDIKRRKELEEDLKRADRLALMGTLAAGLAHEIRNPLGGIKGAAQLLRRSADGDASIHDFTDIMIREVDRVNQLIEQLLDLSRPSQIKFAAINIHEILEDVLLLENQALTGKELHVRKRFDPSLPPIRGDRAQLTQVFLNLVKNAFQAMDAGGVLTLTTRLETDYSPTMDRASLKRTWRIFFHRSLRPKSTVRVWVSRPAIASCASMAAQFAWKALREKAALSKFRWWWRTEQDGSRKNSHR
jgi:two-component system nitrogen regulation sensor histidine kinase GlnL